MAVLTYNKLGDKLIADVGYLGKDLTSLPVHIQICKPDNVEIFLETILRLDEKLIEESRAEVQRARDKLKSKAK